MIRYLYITFVIFLIYSLSCSSSTSKTNVYSADFKLHVKNIDNYSINATLSYEGCDNVDNSNMNVKNEKRSIDLGTIGPGATKSYDINIYWVDSSSIKVKITGNNSIMRGSVNYSTAIDNGFKDIRSAEIKLE